jgi:hypothetical protein
MLPPSRDTDAAYECALAKLGALISGRSRGDGRSWEWEHAMEVMDMCLEVSERDVGREWGRWRERGRFKAPLSNARRRTTPFPLPT